MLEMRLRFGSYCAKRLGKLAAAAWFIFQARRPEGENPSVIRVPRSVAKKAGALSRGSRHCPICGQNSIGTPTRRQRGLTLRCLVAKAAPARSREATARILSGSNSATVRGGILYDNIILRSLRHDRLIALIPIYGLCPELPGWPEKGFPGAGKYGRAGAPPRSRPF